ncbi:PTS sugar transporter subunit IIA [Enterococcus gilvus]|uniref:PTS sugar transporter subunit IIA n=1 Tax=Enterococcus gilvus TaxID=160453 RepID=UPI001C8BD753|nr:fructose PTS transporter subunit IIA [Enterococcus gilvus]MBX8938603.1 PTS transporter subunit EIIA [Enterococcus gilvus]
MDFKESNILLDVAVASKEELFEVIADYAYESGYVANVAETCKAFNEREAEYSTGLQDGFAIPHAKADTVLEPTVLFIRLAREVEWETFDDSTVKNVFALMVPKEDEGTVHLEMLSRLATALLEDEFIQQIQESEDKTQLVELIKKVMIGEKII